MFTRVITTNTSPSLAQIRLLRQDLSRRAIKHKPLARKNGRPLPSQLTLNIEFISLLLFFYCDFV